jgi:DDE superfamily endonuclease
VDIGVVGGGLRRSRLEPPARECADHPRCHFASRDQLETRQTLDDEPSPRVCTKTNRRAQLIRLALGCPTLALGFQDDVWWSRRAQPSRYAWTEATPLRLVAKAAPKADTDRKALAGDGLLLPQTDTMLLRVVNGRPVRQVTCDDLAWLADHMAHDGKKALVLIWDKASWHRSTIVRQWLNAHHQRVKREGGGRLLVCYLPRQSPWLNPIEPRWVQGTRAILEPTRLLTAQELIERVCNYYGCENLTPITQQVR